MVVMTATRRVGICRKSSTWNLSICIPTGCLHLLQGALYGKEVIIADREMVELVLAAPADLQHMPSPIMFFLCVIPEDD